MLRNARPWLRVLLAVALLAPAPAAARRRHRIRHDPGYPARVPIRRLDGRTLEPAVIDTTVLRLMRAAGVPGLGIALIHQGHVAYLKAYGWRDRERALPLTGRTVMCGGSLTGVVLARAAVQMAVSGTLALDRPVADLVPALRTGEGAFGELAADPRAARITPRMLLAHTSGLANLRADEPDRRLRLHFEPGSRFAYSGAGLELLQAAMESASGESLQALADDRVFAALGMWRSGLVWKPRFDDDVATGYDEDGRPVAAPHPAAADAAGSLSTTLEDFSRLLAGLLADAWIHAPQADTLLGRRVDIVSAHEFPTLDSLPSPATRAAGLGYGLGWGLFRTPLGEAFFQEGRAAGWRHYAVGFRDTGDGLLIMSNGANAEGVFVPLLEAVLGDPWTPATWEGFTPWDRRPPRPAQEERPAFTPAPADLAGLPGTYRLPPDLRVVVRLADGRLSAQQNDEPAQELVAEGPLEFRSSASGDHWTFEADSSGRATALVRHLGGRDVRLARDGQAGSGDSP